jgi:hypothetical protein
VSHAADTHYGYAILPGDLNGMFHAHFGGDLAGGVIGMQNAAAGAGFFKAKGGMTIGAAF